MKLQVKVPLLAMLILIIIGILSGGTMLYFQREASINQFEHMAGALAGVAQGSLERSMLTCELETIQQAIVHIREEKMVSGVVLFSLERTIAASSEVSEIGEITDVSEVRQALQSGEASIRTERQSGKSELWVITPVFNKPDCQTCHSPETRVLGAIQVSLDTTSLDKQTEQQTIFFGTLGILTLLVIGGGLAFALKRTILGPLSSLAQSAGSLSRGDYTARAGNDKNDEIGLLSQTFNEMADSVEQRTQELEASRQELAGWNIDLENKVQQRTKELSALNAVITTISQSLNLDKLLNDALNKVLSVMGIEAGMVHLLDEKTNQLMMMLHRGLSSKYIQGVIKLKPGEGIAGRVIQSGKPIVVNDVTDSPETIAPVGKKGEFRAYASLPVKSQNKVIGVLSLASYQSDKFEPETMRLLVAMGDAMGIAVENARGTKRLEEMSVVREQLLEKLISAQEEERRRIARELHDEASQSLAALALNLEGAADTLPSRYRETKQKLNILKEQAKETLVGIRNLALELRPSVLDDLGLSMAIDWYARDYLSKRGLNVEVEVLKPEVKLPPYTETMLFRIIQEALTNVVKHAEADKVKVQLQLSDSMIIAQVEDNGKGFDVDAAIKGKGGQQNLGIHGMAERTTLLGGTFSIKSQPAKGTRLHVEVPFAKENTFHE
ncbi:GAF domain-containing protein [Chloroflexota bacterium]